MAENLARHMIGELQSSFSNGFFCRRCYVTSAEKNTLMGLAKVGTQTNKQYDDLVQHIINNLRKVPSMDVIASSPLHELIDFHSIMSLVAEIMRDFLEDACTLVTQYVSTQTSIFSASCELWREILFLARKS